MGLATGTPLGSVHSQEDLYVEGAPYVFFQDYAANPLNNPDTDGYHWGLSGTTPYPVKSLGCVLDVSLSEGVTMNDVRCDTVGTKDAIQKRDYIELNLTISSLFPLSITSDVMNLSTATVSSGIEKVGIGAINNTKKYMVYMPRVYDESTGDYILIHLHKAKFIDAWTVDMKAGEPWTITNLKIRAFADDTKAAKEIFGVFVRSDVSALP
jgi:hypothetical protein